MLNMLALERMINMRHVIGNLKNHKKWFLKQEKAVNTKKKRERKQAEKANNP